MHDSAIDRLRGLLDVAAAVRTGGELGSVLEAVAGAIAGPLGYRAVVINLYRPAWDDFEVVVVFGNEESQELLMGQTSGMEDWSGLLSERFLQQGAYFVPAGEYDWSGERVQVYTPELEISDAPDAWHPDDALMVPMRSGDGALLGIVSVDEPETGRRPSPIELELLSTVVAHAAVAVEQAQTAELGRRHRAAVEHLLAVSAKLTERRTEEEVLDAVCWGTREALGFHKVVAFLAEEGKLVPLSGVGFTPERAAEFPLVEVAALEQLLDPAYMRHGCIVMERDVAVERAPDFGGVYSSVSNGRGPLAWNHHWVVVPLHDSAGRLDGMMWVDDPKDRLLPSDEALQALRAFANQAMGAIESARRLESLEHLAAHDPLTGLRNRRGFELAIERHFADAGPGGDLSLLVIDLDHFKRVNDSLGHDAGDDVLRRFATLLREAAGEADVPTRLGGEEFALVLPGAAEARALALAEQIRALVRREFDGFACPVSVSVGVAGRGPEARDAAELRRAANRALYAAKRLGRDRCVVHHAQTLEMLDALRDAEGGGGGAARGGDAAGRDARPARRRHRPPLRDRRPLRRADRARARLRGGRDRARARRRHPPRHRQARHRRRDPAQARRARRPRVGRDQAPPRARAPGSSSTPTCATSRPGCCITTSASTAPATRARWPARRSRSRRASSRSRTPTRR